MAVVAFLGLGVMGFPMAGHLSKAGHEVRVWNRTAKKARDWATRYDGAACDSVEAAVDGADCVFMCLGDDPDVRVVADLALPAMKSGAALVDHTTASAELARQLAETAKAMGIGFLDAPVSGGQAGADNGVLTVMAGGELEQFERARPVIDSYARCAELMGPVGSGQLCKMVNQICIAGVVQGLAEGMHFAQKAGLDGDKVLEVIGKGAAQSWQMDNRGHTMLKDEYDFGFAVDWMRKDLGIALDEARGNGAQLPLTALVDQFYAEVQRLGGSRMDSSSLKLRLPK